MKMLKFGIIVSFLASFLAVASANAAYVRHISPMDARLIALQVHPGTVTREKMTLTKKGKYRYDFIIRNRNGRYKVGIDAVSGQVVQNMREGIRAHRSSFWDRLTVRK